MIIYISETKLNKIEEDWDRLEMMNFLKSKTPKICDVAAVTVLISQAVKEVQLHLHDRDPPYNGDLEGKGLGRVSDGVCIIGRTDGQMDG